MVQTCALLWRHPCRIHYQQPQVRRNCRRNLCVTLIHSHRDSRCLDRKNAPDAMASRAFMAKFRMIWLTVAGSASIHLTWQSKKTFTSMFSEINRLSMSSIFRISASKSMGAPSMLRSDQTLRAWLSTLFLEARVRYSLESSFFFVRYLKRFQESLSVSKHNGQNVVKIVRYPLASKPTASIF